MEFEQDDAKTATNETKHGVTFAEAATVFTDAPADDFYDEDHSDDEVRSVIIGRAESGRLLYCVVHGARRQNTHYQCAYLSRARTQTIRGRHMNSTGDYELPAELDFSKLRVRKAGKGRRWLELGVPNSDYDPRFDPSRHFRGVILGAMEAGENADTETGIDGKLAPEAQTAPNVTLDADVAKVFKNAAAVNTALRLVLQIAGDGTDRAIASSLGQFVIFYENCSKGQFPRFLATFNR